MEIRTLESKRVREAARVLAEAFTDEPLITQMVPLGTLHRQRKIADYFVWNMRHTGLRTVDVAVDPHHETIVGVALWRPPGHVSRWLPGLPAKPGVLRGVGLRGLRVLEAHTAAVADLHPDEPHWHLIGVGTSRRHSPGTPATPVPEVEAALIAHRLREIDGTGCLASLEARTPEHVERYVDFGFAPHCTLDGAAVGTAMMWRAPAARLAA
ncbi:hypothetical protein ACFSWE_01785 [Leucobacter albus]|uniref:Acetyltransferase (GNAT) family protein n=1 Tax=Leucobacter albus TaxID=272210 RepID=A0ABW3TMQ4_9MICO